MLTRSHLFIVLIAVISADPPPPSAPPPPPTSEVASATASATTSATTSVVDHAPIKKVPPPSTIEAAPTVATPPTTTTTSIPAPVLVPDDEDLIDDNDWEKVPKGHKQSVDLVSGNSIIPLTQTLAHILLALITCTMLVWFCGGGQQINQMMETKNQKLKAK
jgi:hypothetical protein